MTEPSPSRSLEIPTTLITRIGLAIARPKWALAIAGGRRHPGRSGSDLIAVLLLVVIATQLRGLVGAFWLGASVSAGLGFKAAVQIFTRALTLDLAVLVIGAVILWLSAGKRRDLGRAFDLACVAVLPMVLIGLVFAVIYRALDVAPPVAVLWGMTATGWLWTAVLLAFAVRIARVAPTQTPAPSTGTGLSAWQAGWGAMAVIGVGLALQSIWIARNVDQMRPVVDGDPAPLFTLPEIADVKGTLGKPHALADSRGKIVVVDFWATWCKPCIQSMPALQKLARSADVEVIAINLDAPARAWAMFNSSKYTMTLVADDGEVSERYGVSPIPHTVIIDPEGRVRGVFRGGGNDLASVVEQIRK